MFALLLACLIAACGATPWFHHDNPPFHSQPEFNHGFDHHDPQHHQHDSFQNDIFDARQFWLEMANKLRQLNDKLDQFNDKLATTSSTQGVKGNQYTLTILLKGFNEKDNVVKDPEGLLNVQAVHKLNGEKVGERSFLDIMTLPSTVNVTGSWTLDKNGLKVVFPMKTDANSKIVDGSVNKTLVTEASVLKEHGPEDPKHNNEDVNVDIEPRLGSMKS